MDEEFLINILIAGKKYQLTIERQQEEIVRAAAAQLNSKLLQYGQHYGNGLDIKDLLAMVALHLSINNLELEGKNDTAPFTLKISELTAELEDYLKR